MAMIQFLRGTQAGLAAKETINGALYFTTDTHKIYMGTETGKQEFSAIEVVSAVGALPSVATAIKGKFYYAEAENVFCFPYNGEWKQVNPDTGATSIEVVDGGGNAISAASYDALTRKITLTKGETFATPAVVDGKISAKVGELKIGDTTYDTVKAYVDQKTSGIATDASLSALTNRVTTAEGEIDALQAATAEGGAVTLAIADAKKAGTDAAAALESYKTTNDAAVQANASAISAINDADTGILTQAKSYADGKDAAITAAKAAADAAQADVDALEAKVGTVADGKTVVGLIGTAQAAADAAQSDVDALEAKVGTVPADKTVVQMIADAQDAATYDDTQVKADIKANADAIGVLNGTGDGSVSKQVADAVASIVADAPEAYDTLKEISDWISSHASDAAAMNSQINTNKTNIANLTALVGTLPETAASGTVVGYIDEAIAALKIGDYAKAADLSAAVARIGTAEGKITTLEGQVATINGDATTTGSIAKAAADTLASAKTYADQSEADAVAAAKDYTDELANGQVKTNTEAIATKAAQADLDAAVTRIGTAESEIDALQEASATHATKTEVSNVQTALNEYKTSNDAAVTLKANAADVYTKTDVYNKTETYTQAEVDAKLTGALSWGEF